MNKLVMSTSHWEKAKDHLLRTDGERFAFFLCGVAEFNNSISFIVRDFVAIQDTDIEFANGIGLKLDLRVLLQLTNRARRERLALVEAHSHPWSKTNASFSAIDMMGLNEFVLFILDDLPGSPYAATVWGQTSVDGLFWKSSARNQSSLAEIRVIGDTLMRIPTTSELRRGKRRPKTDSKRDSRQVLLIGEQGQARIRQTEVAIIGLGGLGSHLAQMLAYLGVRDFMLVDPDKVDITNLNRLIGAGSSDISKAKVKIAERMIKQIVGKDNLAIRAFESDLREKAVIDALKTTDVIFGCVDNDGSRLVLNELSLAYMIPYIDCGFGINTENYKIQEAGGRVVFVRPDGPCLLCCKEISPSAASDDLAPREELEVRKKQGYVSGADVPSPSVVSLDGTVASIAATEFLALVTGFKPVQIYTFYDMLEQRMVPRLVRPDSKCVACSVKGLGDKAGVERYVNTRIPKDIPSFKRVVAGEEEVK